MFYSIINILIFFSDYVRKSVGNEKTFREICEPEELHKKCEELCDDLIEDLKPLNMLVCIDSIFYELYLC